MLRQKPELNTIYISERMRHSLQPVARSSLTAVVAPMGYGKTTAINWYLNERGREGAAVLRVSIYSANRAIFWKSLQKAFAQAGLTVLEGYECPTDASGAALLLDDLCTALAGEREIDLFLDDFHLLRDEQAAAFLCALANRLPGNAHLVVASRNDFLPQGEILRLGQRLHRVGADQLRLNEKELSAYVRRCGMELTAGNLAPLLRGLVLCHLPQSPRAGGAGHPAAHQFGHLRHVHRGHDRVPVSAAAGVLGRDGPGR